MSSIVENLMKPSVECESEILASQREMMRDALRMRTSLSEQPQQPPDDGEEEDSLAVWFRPAHPYAPASLHLVLSRDDTP